MGEKRGQSMPERKSINRGILRFSLFIVIILAVVVGVGLYLFSSGTGSVGRLLSSLKSVLIVCVGFGAVIMIHELGHFIACRIFDIKVEAFSIGFPPFVISLRRTAGGFKKRFFPKGFDTAPANEGDGETEYMIGLLPLGGFVKPLGQDDVGVSDRTDDPRSFANKPPLIRIFMAAAGVTCNAISAVLIFIIVFSVGMKLPPAIVGGIEPGSPAAEAGLEAGDKIRQINGETFIDFTSLQLSAALSTEQDPVKLVVEKKDGGTKTVSLVAEQSASAALPIKTFGIQQPETLEIVEFAKREENEQYYGMTGLKGGDSITAVNGEPVETAWQMRQKVAEILAPSAELTVQRKQPGGETVSETVAVDLYVSEKYSFFTSEFDLSHFMSLVPRLKILDVTAKHKDVLKPGDVIVKAGETENPNYRELRIITIDHKDKPLPMTLLRKDEQSGEDTFVNVSVEPDVSPGSDRVTIGIMVGLDMSRPVAADTLELEEADYEVALPRGARIVWVAGNKTESFFDIARQIRQNLGGTITIEYTNEGEAGSITVAVPDDKGVIHAESSFAVPVPIKAMKKVYKAGNPAQAIKMGIKKAWHFIANTYITLRRIITGSVSPKGLSGPVGILTMSYTIASQRPLIEYAYFMGLLSTAIAVFNFLPLPVLDGGLIVMFVIEMFTKKQVSPKIQGMINAVGWALLLTLMLWVTYNDIVNMIRM